MAKEIQLHIGDEIIYYDSPDDKKIDKLEDEMRKERPELKNCVVTYDETSNLSFWIKQGQNSKTLGNKTVRNLKN